MTSYIEQLISQKIQVISNEGRVFCGDLISFDQSMNIILKDCIEKIYSPDSGVKFEKMGLYMLRGDNIAIVSEINEEIEKSIVYEKIKGKKLTEFIQHDK